MVLEAPGVFCVLGASLHTIIRTRKGALALKSGRKLHGSFMVKIGCYASDIPMI